MNPDAYRFTIADTTVELTGAEGGGGGTGSVTVEVTSNLTRHDIVALSIEPDDGADDRWFVVEPEERFLNAGAALTATVTVSIPAEAGPGPRGFRLRARAASDPDSDSSLSPQVVTTGDSAAAEPDPAPPPEAMVELVEEPAPDEPPDTPVEPSDGTDEPLDPRPEEPPSARPPADERPSGIVIPRWAAAAAAGVIVVLLAAIAALALSGGGDGGSAIEVTDTTVRAEEVPAPEAPATDVVNVIGRPLAEAEAAFAGTFTAFADTPDPASSGEQCVLLQAPVAGTVAPSLIVMTTSCPSPAPRPALPSSVENECAASASFCDALSQFFPDPQANAAWQDAKLGMVAAFIERFSVPGVETPTVVGLGLAEARAALAAARLDATEVDGGGEAEAVCRDEAGAEIGRPVLLQHPYPGQLTAEATPVSLVLVPCPEIVTRPELVTIDALLDVEGFGNLEAAVPAFAQALGGDPTLGPDYVGSAPMTADLAAMVDVFRHAFATARIPDVIGLPIQQGRSLMESVGLAVEVQETDQAIEYPAYQPNTCLVFNTVEQSFEAGTLVASLAPDATVILEFAFDVRPCDAAGADWAEANQLYEFRGVPNVIGAPVDQAKALLEAEGLTVEIQHAAGNFFPWSHDSRTECITLVTSSQSVDGGTRLSFVPDNLIVVLEFEFQSVPCDTAHSSLLASAQTLELRALPALINLPLDVAEAFVAKLGLGTYIVRNARYSLNLCPVSRIQSQSIDAGTPASELPGATIQLVYETYDYGPRTCQGY